MPYRAALAIVVVAGTIGGFALADHRHKQASTNRLQRAEWYCEHRATRCGGRSSDALEENWERREVAYETAVVVFAAAACGLAVRTRRSNRPTG